MEAFCGARLQREAQHSTAQHSTAQHSTAQQVGGGTGDRRREDMMSSHLMVEERILEGKEGCGAALLHFCLRTSFLTSHFTQGFMHVPAEMIPEALFRIIFLHIIVAFGNPENLHFSPFSFIFHIKLFFSCLVRYVRQILKFFIHETIFHFPSNNNSLS